jgi:AcrR family transcriptional regulator
MAEGVKPRRYDSPRRREQAAATRREILTSAQRLFERDGYAATTMAGVAAGAGVALKTVYVAFGTKSELLRALWHILLRGDEDDVPVGDRRWYREVVAQTDPVRQIELTARNSRLVKVRAAKLMRVIRDAAAGDADISALWSRIQSDFYENQRVIVEALARHGGLRPGLDVAGATDVLWTLNHPDVWLLLVGERGWTPDDFERWFAETMRTQLLPPGA